MQEQPGTLAATPAPNPAPAGGGAAQPVMLGLMAVLVIAAVMLAAAVFRKKK